MLELRHLSLDDKYLIDKYIPDCCKKMCDFTFGNLYTWSMAEHTEIAESNGFLFLRSTFNGVTSYAFPWGEGDCKSALQEICDDARERGADLSFYCVADEQLPLLMSFFGDGLVFKEQRDYFDYVYFSEKLATLSGRKLHSKKNHVNSFTKKYDYTVEDICANNVEECASFSKKWFKENESTQALEAERQVIGRALKNLSDLYFDGILLKVKGEAVAFCLGEKMADGETFCVHFEKALKDYATAYSVVNSLFAQKLQKRYKYINREDDAGVDGLRKAKLSYQPEFLVKKYYAKVI